MAQQGAAQLFVFRAAETQARKPAVGAVLLVFGAHIRPEEHALCGFCTLENRAQERRVHLPAGRVAAVPNCFQGEPAVLNAAALEHFRRQSVRQQRFEISRGLHGRFVQALHQLPVDVQGAAPRHPAQDVLVAVQGAQKVVELWNRPVLHREAELHLRDFGVFRGGRLFCRVYFRFGLHRRFFAALLIVSYF